MMIAYESALERARWLTAEAHNNPIVRSRLERGLKPEVRVSPTDHEQAILRRVARGLHPRATPEQQLHRAVAQFLSVALPSEAWFSTMPLGGGGKRRGAILHGLGVVPGLPDILVIDGGRALFVELKAPKGQVSAPQFLCHQQLRHRGVPVAVCRSINEVGQFLRENGVRLREHVASTS